MQAVPRSLDPMSRATQTAPARATDAQELAQAPDANAMGLLAAACEASGDTAAAIEWYGKAAKAQPEVAAWHHRLGNLHQDAGRVDRAITCYRQALRRDPAFAEAYNDLGSAYYTKTFYADAEKNFREAVRLKPGHDVALANLGAALRRQGRLGEARKAYQRALWIRIVRLVRGSRWQPAAASDVARTDDAGAPAAQRLAEIRRLRSAGETQKAQELAEALVNEQPLLHAAVLELASILAQKRSFAAAIEMYGRALAIVPADAQAQLALANVYLGFGAGGEAARCLRNALALDASLAKARLQLGFALLNLGYPQDAEKTFLEARQQDPGSLEARLGLALAHRDQDRVEEASAEVRCIDDAAIQDADNLNRLGVVLMGAPDTLERAVGLFRRALQRSGSPVPALVNLGLAEQQAGRFDEALNHFLQAQRYEPFSPAANFNEAVLRLLRGDFERGWEKYHWRAKLGGHKFNYPRFAERKLWDGSPLAGRTLFVHGEQGLGDEIMFASCYPELLAQGCKLVIGCDARLDALFRRSFPGAQIAPAAAADRLLWERSAPPTELYSPGGDLPYFLRRSRVAFPEYRGFLRADAAKVERWRERLRALGERPKIGVSWRGGAAVSWSRRRSMSLADLLPLLRHDAVFVNLQYGERGAELEALRREHGVTVHDFAEAIDDLDETAALCCALDGVATVCTAIVHMSGALARPAWVMAPHVPEWRYGASGESMPWYPSVRIFRQPEPGAWRPVLERVSAEIARLAQRS